MIGQTISHYRIVGRLGEGGMGAVYVAEDTLLGRRVAVKLPTNGSNKHRSYSRFLREARAVSALSHPHIAAIFDYGETTEGQPFIIMELVNGQTLSELLLGERMTLKRAVEIIEDVAEALSEAHTRGIIHRDIKPSNIIINEQGQVKVLDFGLAKQLHDEPSRSADPNAQTLRETHTQSGILVGTPLYLSPEQAKGAPVDARSDLFALGAVFYECITGKPAFSVANAGVIEIAYNVMHLDPAPPSTLNPGVPKLLDHVVCKALAKKPDERYQSAEEFIEDLQAAQDILQDQEMEKTLSQRIVPIRERAHPSALHTLSNMLRRPRLPIGLVALGALLVIMAGWLIVRGSRPVAHQPSSEAERWYQTGTSALRDGAYYQASKAFEQAIAADGEYALAHARLAEAWMELDYTDRAKDETLRVSSMVGDRSALPPLDRLYLDAIIATASHDYPSAIAAYSEIARLTPNQAHVYVDLGRAFENVGDYAQALPNYVKATSLDTQYATAYLRAGMLYARQLNSSSANAEFDKAETIYQALGNFEGRAEVLYQRGALLVKLSKGAEARAQLQQALDLSRVNNNQFQQIKAMLQMVYVLQSEGETAQAQKFASDAVELARANGMENLTSRGLVDLGNSLMSLGDYTEAEKYFRQALDFAQRSRARSNEARALLSLGSLRIQQSNPDEAVRYVEQAFPFYQQGDYRKEMAQALTLLGRAKRLKGDYEAALSAYQRQLQDAEQVDDDSQKALSHEGIGTVMARQERYPEALRHFEERYALSKKLGDRKSISYALTERGTMLWQLGRYDEAKAMLKEAFALVAKPDASKALLATIHLVTSEMMLSERRFSEAGTESQSAIALAGTESADLALQARSVSGQALVFSGAKDEGRVLCEDAVGMAAKLGDPWLMSQALLALAEVKLAGNDAGGALTLALRAQESFARAGQQASEWRALLVAARASRRTHEMKKARDYSARAAELLAGLERKWQTADYNSYLNRKDVQFFRKQLSDLLAELK